MSQLSGWPALVLTAGLGTRLHPLSLVRPKAALPVAGEVLIGRILRRLREFGISRAVLNLHHLPEAIAREVGDGSRFGMHVRYSWESTILGSAGGPARAIPLLEADRFLIINGDTMANVDLADLASAHVKSGALVTMAVVDGDPRYGGVVADDQGAVTSFIPPSLATTSPTSFGAASLGTTGTSTLGTSTLGTSTLGTHPLAPLAPGTLGTSTLGTHPLAPLAPGTLGTSTLGTHPLAPLAPGTLGTSTLGTFHFVGAQAVNAAAFSGVNPNQPLETVRDLYPRLIAARPGTVRVYSNDAEFLDIGTPAGYLHMTSRVAAREGKPLDRGARCTIAPDAEVERTILWDDVTVESRASLIECIVADGVTIPAGARFQRCSLVMLDGKMVTVPF